MQIRDFTLERFFAAHEFKARHLLSASDCESLPMATLIAMADPEVARLWRDLGLGYTESQGHPLLREEIGRSYGLGPEGVLVAAPAEAIFIAMHALLSPGDRVVAPWPAYQSLGEVAASIGCEMLRWPLSAREGGWQIDVDQLDALLERKPRLVVLNFPHNPTGFLPDRATFEAIVRKIEAAGALVFSDEMYRLLEYDPGDRLPPASSLSDRAITLAGLSKAHGLPGLRVGWLASGDPGIVAGFARLRDYTTLCTSAPSEILGLIALRNAGAITGRNLAIVRGNLALVDAFRARHPESLEWLAPRAGSVAFPRWRGKETVTALSARLLERHGILLVPGEMFECPGGYCRIGLGRNAFGAALACFEEALGEL